MSKGKNKNKNKRARVQSSTSSMDNSTAAEPPCCVCDQHNNINNDIGDIQTNIKTIEQSIANIKSNNELPEILENVISDIKSLQDAYNTSPLQLLIECVIKQQQQITHIASEIIDLKARSMRRNVILHNVPEAEGEDPEKLLKDHITKMGVTGGELVVERAHRMGAQRPPGSNPRPLVAAFTSSKMTERVLKARPAFDRSKLKEKKKNNKDSWITAHLPQEMLEEKKRLNYIADHYKEEAKKAEKNVRVSIKLDKLRINDELIRPKVNYPGIDTLLRIDSDERQELHDQFKYEQFDKLSKDNDSVTGFKPTKQLKCYNDLNQGYKAFLLRRNMLSQNTGLVYNLSGDKGFCSSGGAFGTFASMVIEEMGEVNFSMFIVASGSLEKFRKESVKALVSKYKKS